jgi:DNA helicase HerA-like ATPase
MTSMAYSVDGRTFRFESSLADAETVGSYIMVTTENGDAYLGQIVDALIIEDRVAGGAHRLTGSGRLLARVVDNGFQQLDRSTVFAEAEVSAAESELVRAHFEAARGSTAPINLGTLQGSADIPAVLHAKGFDRHTFMCGQSGSGKTYSLGVVLEQLLIETDIQIAVIDPNSDYVNIGSIRPEEAAGLPADQYLRSAGRYNEISPRVLVFGGEGSDRRFQVVFSRLSFEQQTMVLGLNPIADAEEFNAFVRTVRQFEDADYTIDDLMEMIKSSFNEDVRRLGLRIDNLGIQQQSIWALRGETVMDQLPPEWRMVVADIGSLPSAVEGSIAAAALLTHLWERRRDRQPVLVVIDEAHNICPQDPVDANQALATEQVIRIASEGRKYGIYLLLSTQRPSKVHRNVISQCDNLLLMKMNSASDLASLTETFSYAPAGLIERAAGFQLGEGLAAGKIAPDPLLFKGGRRLTLEGGSDVPSSWAKAR